MQLQVKIYFYPTNQNRKKKTNGKQPGIKKEIRTSSILR